MGTFGLSEDQRALRDSARSMLDAQSPLSLTRAAYDDPDAWRPLWKTVVDLGWTAVISSEPDAEAMLNAVVLLEEAGRVALSAPLLSTLAAASVLAGERAETGGLLDEIAEGAVAAYSFGDQLEVVRDAPRADLFVIGQRVYRRSEVEVDPAAESIDPSQPVGRVTLRAEPLHVVAGSDNYAALVLAAAELVGVADRALWMGVEHAKSRQQFGQPIGAFQGVKHRLADAYVAVERARSLTYLSASQGGRREALLAKAAANDAAGIATRANVAVHGAIAQTWEHDAHLLVRRSWLGGSLLGDSASLYARAARDFVASLSEVAS
jgi:alkylation response protein AidB-like acyl-CoA dehydrogenase